MKIGDAGEAFFIFETEGDIPEDLITSPLLEATKVGQSNVQVLKTGRFGAREDADDDVEAMGGDMGESGAAAQGDSAEQEPDFLDLNETGLIQNGEASGSGSREEERKKSKKDQQGLLSKTVGVGKAVIDVVGSVEREKRAELKDQAEAARNVTENLVEQEVYGVGKESEQDVRMRIIGTDLGDDALPKIEKEDLQTPQVIDNGGMLVLSQNTPMAIAEGYPFIIN